MTSREKLIQYLSEAHATEQALVRTLQAHIAMTPEGEYRSGLERHLGETRDHAERTAARLSELGEGRGIVSTGVGVIQGLVGQTLALAKGPLDVVRGSGGEEKLLKNAKDECATEALEIATYDALERLALRVGDERTAELAASIRADEERMLAGLRSQIPQLTDDVVAAELSGEQVYDVAQTGAAQAGRGAAKSARAKGAGAAGSAKRGARSGARKTRQGARRGAEGAEQAAKRGAGRARSAGDTAAEQARRAPGVARAEGEVKGTVASASDLPITGYDDLNADEISSRLTDLSQVELGKVDAYERRHENRSTVLERISALSGSEPWAGYDEANVDEIRSSLADRDADDVREALAYERRHKNRRGVIDAAEARRSEAATG